jgi:hypothetical protein
MNITLRRLLELGLTTVCLGFYFFVIQTRGMADMGILASVLDEVPANAGILFISILSGFLMASFFPLKFVLHLRMMMLLALVVSDMFLNATGRDPISMVQFFAIAGKIFAISIALVFKKE